VDRVYSPAPFTIMISRIRARGLLRRIQKSFKKPLKCGKFFKDDVLLL